MVAIERRISRMSHPDLPFDAAAFKNDSSSPRTSWRPSWLTKSSTSSRHSHNSSLSTARSTSVSTRRTTADMHNVYQLPNSPLEQTKAMDQPERPVSPSPSDMRFEYMDATFDFPLPAAIQNHPPTDSVLGDDVERQERIPSRAANHRTTASTCNSSVSRSDTASSIAAPSSLASESLTRPMTSISINRKARDVKSDQETEIEMVSKEQFGYWNASFVTRIPATAALCGTVLLTAKMPHRQAAESVTSSQCSAGHAAIAAAEFAGELYSATSPDEIVRNIRRRGLGSAALMLKASLDAAQVPGIPLKNAMAMFKKAKQSVEEDHHKLWSHALKQLKKMSQDRLVLVMFLVCVARKLQRRNMTIDGQEPSLYLLKGLWPSSLAINDDPWVIQNLSRLLVSHFDEFPADFPTKLEAVNYRFASGKRYNMLGLMADKKNHTGPGGVKEIAATDEHRRVSQW